MIPEFNLIRGGCAPDCRAFCECDLGDDGISDKVCGDLRTAVSCDSCTGFEILPHCALCIIDGIGAYFEYTNDISCYCPDAEDFVSDDSRLATTMHFGWHLPTEGGCQPSGGSCGEDRPEGESLTEIARRLCGDEEATTRWQLYRSCGGTNLTCVHGVSDWKIITVFGGAFVEAEFFGVDCTPGDDASQYLENADTYDQSFELGVPDLDPLPDGVPEGTKDCEHRGFELPEALMLKVTAICPEESTGPVLVLLPFTVGYEDTIECPPCVTICCTVVFDEDNTYAEYDLGTETSTIHVKFEIICNGSCLCEDVATGGGQGIISVQYGGLGIPQTDTIPGVPGIYTYTFSDTGDISSHWFISINWECLNDEIVPPCDIFANCPDGTICDEVISTKELANDE